MCSENTEKAARPPVICLLSRTRIMYRVVTFEFVCALFLLWVFSVWRAEHSQPLQQPARTPELQAMRLVWSRPACRRGYHPESKVRNHYLDVAAAGFEDRENPWPFSAEAKRKGQTSCWGLVRAQSTFRLAFPFSPSQNIQEFSQPSKSLPVLFGPI